MAKHLLNQQSNALKKLLILLFALLIAPFSSATAKDWPVTQGWIVSGANGHCGIYRKVPAGQPTNFFLFMSAEGQVGIRAYDGEWSLKTGKNYDVEFQFDNEKVGTVAPAVSAPDGTKGFLALVQKDWLFRFANSSSVIIHPREASFLTVPLYGAGEAIGVLQQCVNDLNATSGGTAKVPWKFAQPVPGKWVKSGDYPDLARKERRQGTTMFRLTISAQGNATDCEIIESSGSIDLDEKTCTLLIGRAKFRPAVTRNGEKIPSTFQSTLHWTLP